MTTAWIVGGYLFFVLLGVALWAYSRNKKTPVASVGELIDRIMHHRTTRVSILLAWWWVGWHFLVNVIGR
jgi:hypothetical protein